MTLEQKRKLVFGDETSAGDEGVIAESIKVVNDKFKLSEKQIDEALAFLYSIKNSFLGAAKHTSLDQILNELSAQIISHLKLKENLIKKTCKELGLTYRELGERIGYSESALNNASRQDKISDPLTFAINLYLENLKLKEELEDFRILKKILTKRL